MVALCVTLFTQVVAQAHEGHLHRALGTVSSMDGQHVVVKTTDGKSLTVMLDKETMITRGKERVGLSALKVGERLSIDYMEEKGMMMAHAVKLSTTSSQSKK